MKNKQQPNNRASAADTEPMQTKFRALIEEALRAQPYSFRERGGDAEPILVKQSTIKGLSAFLKTAALPSLFNASGELIRTPKGSPAAATITLDSALIKNSRVAQAGAHVFIYEDSTKALATGLTGDVVMESRASAFRLIEPAKFSTVDVDEEDDVATSPLPVSAAGIDFAQAVTKGFRVEIPRSDRKDISTELLCSELVAALTLGLSRAADEVLLSKVATSSPETFTINSVASQGVKFGELRALVGTGLGTVAKVWPDGTLRTCEGVPAELTDTVSDTIIGAFNRAGVAIHESVDIYFERIGKSGLLACTAWTSMLPLVPDVTKFWKAMR